MAITSADYVLVVPREFFKSELSSLINSEGKLNEWTERVELFLEDSFAGTVPKQEFESLRSSAGGDPWSQAPTPEKARRDFLVSLLRRADVLPYRVQRPAYWSERRSGAAPGHALAIDAVAREFCLP